MVAPLLTATAESDIPGSQPGLPTYGPVGLRGAGGRAPATSTRGGACTSVGSPDRRGGPGRSRTTCGRVTAGRSSVSGRGGAVVGSGWRGSRRCWWRSTPCWCRTWMSGGVCCSGRIRGCWGRGGIRLVARAAGSPRRLSRVGRRNWRRASCPRSGPPCGRGPQERARERPQLVAALLALVEPERRGDPESPLLWTTKSTRNLAAALTRQGHRAGPDTVVALLKAEGFSLQGTSRTAEGARYPDPERAVRIHQRARQGIHRRRAAGHQRRHQEEGGAGQLCGRRARVAPRRATGSRARTRLPREGRTGGGPVTGSTT